MVNLICFFITAEFTLFSCLFYSPLIQNSRFKRLTREIQLLLIATNLRCKCLRNLPSRKKDKESPS
ncbi:hypothetical protein [Wolbachia endosymbiont (group B) of Ennomos erosarius]|uniref:hypothetical protein n=1 Tax=Wolbachia endosymbiont (group B) of Ennomos erosarius TaxID=3066175 RepID=UPI0031333C6F